jgi:hypothetical protein
MKVGKRHEVYKSKIFTLVEEEATDPSGFKIERVIVRHGGSAVMLVTNATACCCEEFRLPAEKDLWSPAGRLDPAKSPADGEAS